MTNASDENSPGAGQSEFEAGEYDRALPLLLPLAQSGHAEAQCMVANIYHLGLGRVEPDTHRSIAWYSCAADQGYGIASNNLAGMYQAGVGVQVDRDRAEQLYEQARSQGFLGGCLADAASEET